MDDKIDECTMILNAIKSISLYSDMYDENELNIEGDIIDRESVILVQGIALGDQEDKELLISK